MTVEEIIDKFVKYPGALENGAGSLSKRWSCNVEDVYTARSIVRNRMKYGTDYNPKIVSFNKNPKILILDIETSPSITFTWKRFKENISLDQVIQDPIMLTWCAKWLYSTDIMRDKVTPEEVLHFDDSRIVISLWKLVDEADIVVAHFGNFFDIPFLNSRAVIHGLPPYSSINSIDTKMVASKNFRFPSNKLDALGTYFGVGNKIHTEFNLWRDCIAGNSQALIDMEQYNIQDVILLEDVYLKLRPWIKSHPNYNAYIDSNVDLCAACGSTHIKETGRFYYTQVNKYKEYRCECGALTRSRKNELNRTKDTALPASIR